VRPGSVRARATVKLITGAFDELRKDLSIGRAEALRSAEMAMMDPSNPPEFSHPLAWAPFVSRAKAELGAEGPISFARSIPYTISSVT
jgi:hypothetical protein